MQAKRTDLAQERQVAEGLHGASQGRMGPACTDRDCMASLLLLCKFWVSRQSHELSQKEARLFLLAFLGVQGDFAKSRRVLLELQFLSTGFAKQHIIDVSGFLADQIGCFFLFLALGHGFSKLVPNYLARRYEGCVLCKSIVRLASSTQENPPFGRVSEPKDRKNV